MEGQFDCKRTVVTFSFAHDSCIFHSCMNRRVLSYFCLLVDCFMVFIVFVHFFSKVASATVLGSTCVFVCKKTQYVLSYNSRQNLWNFLPIPPSLGYREREEKAEPRYSYVMFATIYPLIQNCYLFEKIKQFKINKQQDMQNFLQLQLLKMMLFIIS